MVKPTPFLASFVRPATSPLRRALATLGLAVLCALLSVQAAPLRVLLISGRSNHDWQSTTPVLRGILQDSGRFVVDVTERPADLDEKSLEPYDVLVSNWSAWPDVTGHQWGAKAEQAVVGFVRGGKGLALFHAASATFQDWPEFQRLAGATWDKATTGHGRIHAFKVSLTVPDHPVTAGLRDFWIRDELWHGIGITSTNRVLATGYSSKDEGGSGKAEPVLFTGTEGQGRSFYLVLGHDDSTLRNEAWKTLMCRGVEWAATGKVSIPPSSAWPTSPAQALLPDQAGSGAWATFDDGSAFLHSDGLLRLLYRFGQVPFKPYVRGLFSADGQNVVRDAPFDHLHHHGLMYAIRANDINFWEEIPQAGFQVHRRFDDVIRFGRGTEQVTGFAEAIDWVGPDRQTVVMQESRTLLSSRVADAAGPVLTWCTVLRPGTKAPVALAGEHYYGLGMRFPPEMDAQGPFLNADGKEGVVFRGEERLIDSAWCAYAAKLEGRPVTVAMFAHPKNRKFPTTWFTMSRPFAYLSATMRLQDNPLSLTADTPHRECYGVAVFRETVEAGKIESAYQHWLGSAAVARAVTTAP